VGEKFKHRSCDQCDNGYDCSPVWGASPFRLDNYTLHDEPKTYLKEVEKNKKAR
jgi:hypothetical protein